MKKIFSKLLGEDYTWINVVYLLLRIAVAFVLIIQITNRNYENVFLCILTLFLFLIPSFIEKRIHLDIPDVLETIILLFIFSAEILGEINSYYLIFPYWDTMLHTLNGFLAAAIGLSLIDILNRNERFKFALTPIFVALVAFCFSMTIGVLWEFFEYGMDIFAGYDMQKDTYIDTIRTVLLHPEGLNIPIVVNVDSVLINGETWSGYIDIGLKDTMMDLFVNFIGASVFSVFGFFYIKYRGQGTFVKQFIVRKNSKSKPSKTTE